MGMTWTEERVELLCSLWRDGVTGGDIAKELGMTRGMVSGKRHSLGLPPREGAVRKEAERRNGRRTAALCGHVGKAKPEIAHAKAVLAETVWAAVAPLVGSNPMPWELRRPGQCAFPVLGYDDKTWSCCEPCDGLTAYCHGHREILAGRPWPPLDPFGQGLNQWAGA